MTPLSSKLETARTFVPGWWVDAFEASVIAPNLSLNVELCDRGVLPRLNSAELSDLAILLGDIQRQVLESDKFLDFIELDWSNVQKNLSGTDIQARQRLADIVESLSQIRFPIKSVGQELRVVPLFIDESWVPAVDSSQSIKLKLKPNPHILELLSGYTDGHLDFLRKLTGKHSFVSLQRSQPPLVLWTPVWLELSISEQIAYVRMEATMQQEGAWLRLDGLVGCPLDVLTAGIKISSRRQSEDQSPLMEKLRLVGKLGRRLVAHGLIQREPNLGYMAIEKGLQSESPVLLWQASAERLKSKAESEYFGLVSSRILKFCFAENINEFLAVFAALSGVESSMLPVLKGIWDRISVVPGMGSVLNPGIMVQAHLLFIEWIARSHPSSLLPLPETLRKHSALRQVISIDAQNPVERFKDFVAILCRADDLRQIALSHSSFSIFTADIGLNLMSICRDSVKRVKQSYNPSVKIRNDENDIFGDATFKEAPESTVSAKSQSSSTEKVGQQAQNLRRIAQDELDKMIRQSPGAYADLKSKYMASLDEETKSLFLDVQRRLGSKTFDRHLKIRLVHYMVEHPASWNSVSSRLPI